ncbi:MAG: peptide deformylase [Planctomycetes bacterium]|nr:peptide deformylase [Planctomycetota bacterium]
MELRCYPDPVLRQQAEAVTRFDGDLADLVRGMLETMHSSEGLGLAAPQVGVSARVAIISPDVQPGREVVLVNPEIVDSEGWEESDEGCLSFPGIYVKIGRFTRVRARYQDLQGEVREIEAEGLLARALQHELDHLDGRLLVNRMSPVQRMAQRRRLHELRDRYERRLDREKADA